MFTASPEEFPKNSSSRTPCDIQHYLRMKEISEKKTFEKVPNRGGKKEKWNINCQSLKSRTSHLYIGVERV